MTTISLTSQEIEQIALRISSNVGSLGPAMTILRILKKLKAGVNSRFTKALIQGSISDLLIRFPTLGPKKRVKK